MLLSACVIAFKLSFSTTNTYFHSCLKKRMFCGKLNITVNTGFEPRFIPNREIKALVHAGLSRNTSDRYLSRPPVHGAKLLQTHRLPTALVFVCFCLCMKLHWCHVTMLKAITTPGPDVPLLIASPACVHKNRTTAGVTNPVCLSFAFISDA